ncbi:MAG TPA: histidine kinase [Vicinamibacterales bacterium]|nr:histidine kinase [Vicinamibacterales bacterium]
MHPILGRPVRLALYLALWLPLAALLTALLALPGPLSWPQAAAVAFPLLLVYAFLCLSAWYVGRGLPLSSSSMWRVFATAGVSAFVSSALWLTMGRAWIEALATFSTWPAVRAAFRPSAPTLFGFGFLLYLLALAGTYLAAAFEASREAERRGLELQVFAREAELRALRSQIDPHFLFNSLQSISALTTVDPAAARRMCLLLADFLRDTLALGGRDRIPLASELALAERYLAIEQVRFGERLRVSTSDGDVDACLVPPLLLQPLVENAVTHGIAHLLHGGTVRIEAARQGASIAIVVTNPCDPDRPRRSGGGVGLANVRARLRALFEREATLRTTEGDGTFRVEIALPAAGVARAEGG